MCCYQNKKEKPKDKPVLKPCAKVVEKSLCIQRIDLNQSWKDELLASLQTILILSSKTLPFDSHLNFFVSEQLCYIVPPQKTSSKSNPAWFTFQIQSAKSA